MKRSLLLRSLQVTVEFARWQAAQAVTRPIDNGHPESAPSSPDHER